MLIYAVFLATAAISAYTSRYILAAGFLTMLALFFLASSPQPKAVDQKKTLKIVIQALLIDILAFTIILPLFPRLLDYYDKQDGSNSVSRLYLITELFLLLDQIIH